MKEERINNNVVIFEEGGSLAFGTDAYLLSAFMKKSSGSVCELGAGSGVISLLCLAKGKFKSAVCVEVQEKMAEICRMNAEKNGFEREISVISSDMRDLPADMNGTFDVVFSNPPYMKMTSGKLGTCDADVACRHEAYGTIGDFCKTAARLLKFGGLFYAVYRPDRMAELMAYCKAQGLAVKVATLVYPTVSHEPCAVLIRAKKGASDGMKASRPLIMYASKENMTDAGFTDEMKNIYESGDFDDVFR